MLYMRHVGMLRARFGLDVGAWSGYLLVSRIYEIGCLAMFYFVRDLRRMGSYWSFVGDLTKLVCLLLLQFILEGLGEVV